jgi:hypothetical protein
MIHWSFAGYLGLEAAASIAGRLRVSADWTALEPALPV